MASASVSGEQEVPDCEISGRLRAALEADDAEQLLRLCRQLDRNLTVTAGGFNSPQYNPTVREMSVTHHVVCKPYGLDCLKLLIEKFGAECLTCWDGYNYTPVHMAALNQDGPVMEFIYKTVGRKGFEERGGRFRRNAVHCAAMNTRTNSALKWLVGLCGRDSLRVLDAEGGTPMHLAAEFQDSDSMNLIRRELGASCFLQRGQGGRTAVHCAAMNETSNDALKWLVKELGAKYLTMVDGFRNMPIHLAAEFQGPESMELIKSEIGASCFHLRGQCDRTVAHCAAMNCKNDEALRWLVREIGAPCLTVRDGQGNTAVHVAAWMQTAESLEFLADLLGSDIFWTEGFTGWTVTHCAAQNARGNCALVWCIRQLGPTCLLDKDSGGRTPAHMAAQFQGLDSLRLIVDTLGVAGLELVDTEGRTVVDYAGIGRDRDRVMEWIAELRNQRPAVADTELLLSPIRLKQFVLDLS